MATQSKHLHLEMAQARAPWDWARWIVVALGLAGVSMFAAAFFQSWWSFWLYAPQYPGGLRLDIALTGMSGDVKEIDLLNHYIGMKHLEQAAPLERHLAGYGVAGISVITIGLLVSSGRKINWLVAIPAIAFPLIFLGDSFYWLFSYGHALDPHAPLRIAAFTPQLFGNGKIGQFETYATPALGFWLAVMGVVCVALAAVVRTRVCRFCAARGTCRTTCPRFMVLPERTHRKEAVVTS
jgi:copper chaperone NosL